MRTMRLAYGVVEDTRVEGSEAGSGAHAIEHGTSGPPSCSIEVRFEDSGDLDEWMVTRECAILFDREDGEDTDTGIRPVPPRAIVDREDCTRILSPDYVERMGATPVLAMPIREIEQLALPRAALEVVTLIDGSSSFADILTRCSIPTWQTMLAFEALTLKGAIVFVVHDQSA